jgi:hypothetical protein
LASGSQTERALRADAPHNLNLTTQVPMNVGRPREVQAALADLFAQAQANEAAAVLLPWICDALPSPNSRQAYHDDLRHL